MKRPIEQRRQIIQSLVNKEIETEQATQLLDGIILKLCW